MLINFNSHKRNIFVASFFRTSSPDVGEILISQTPNANITRTKCIFYIHKRERDEMLSSNVGGHAADGREKKIKNYLHKKGEKKKKKEKSLANFFPPSLANDIESEDKSFVLWGKNSRDWRRLMRRNLIKWGRNFEEFKGIHPKNRTIFFLNFTKIYLQSPCYKNFE